MHQDFHPGNLLATQGRITGVIDWAIRYFPADEVDHWVELAEQRI